jgi:hypothetical protein
MSLRSEIQREHKFPQETQETILQVQGPNSALNVTAQ